MVATKNTPPSALKAPLYYVVSYHPIMDSGFATYVLGALLMPPPCS